MALVRIATTYHILLMTTKYYISLISLFFSILYSTFSIVAVDVNTGEVGSAGGSCIANSIIISDIHPGVGAIHTQSYWLSANQSYASNLMDQGLSPSEIISLLEENDIQNNPGIRQYGVVSINPGIDYGLLLEDECLEIDNAIWQGDPSIDGPAECLEPDTASSASYTGNNCIDWKGSVNGITYSIQGNILLNEDVINQMESNFLNTNGTLDQKLMSALQGANIPGADTRCLDEGISTLSAFIRVAKPNDNPNNYFMDLNVSNVTPYYAQTGLWIDPIDTLQSLYDQWYDNNFNFEQGDVNQDNIIDILDLVQIVNFILGEFNSGLEFFLSDMNQDNNLNIQDIIIIINIILS